MVEAGERDQMGSALRRAPWRSVSVSGVKWCSFGLQQERLMTGWQPYDKE
jgi:hypothetical protein